MIDNHFKRVSELSAGMITVAVMILVLFLSAGSPADASPLWTNTFGGVGVDAPLSIQETSDGGSFLVGWTDSFGQGSGDVLAVKMDQSGNIQWQKTFGHSGFEGAFSGRQTYDGGYILAGCTDSSGAGMNDILVLKLDNLGNIQWQRTYGGANVDSAYAIRETSEGGFVVIGNTLSFSSTNDIWVLKLDQSGNLQWNKVIDGLKYDEGNDIQETFDGGFILAGHTRSFGAGDGEMLLIKLSNSGDIEFQKTYGTSKTDFAYSVEQLVDGGYIIGGSTFSSTVLDILVVKVDSQGAIQWQKTYGGPDFDKLYAMKATSDGGLIVAGGTSSFGAGNLDLYLLKINSSGDLQWVKSYGGGNDDLAFSVDELSSGEIILAGDTASFGLGDWDAWILRLDSAGNGCDLPSSTGGTAGAAATPSLIVGDSALTASSPQLIPANSTLVSADPRDSNVPKCGSVPFASALSIDDVSVVEGNSGTVYATFTVSTNKVSASQIKVGFQTFDNTAKKGSDYTNKSGTVTIGAGNSSGQITIAVKGDTYAEPNEEFYVFLSKPVNATIYHAYGTGVILNDDSAPAITIKDVTVTEGNSGTQSAIFEVMLSNPFSAAVQVSYATANNTALAGIDYAATSGVLTIPAGSMSGIISIPVIGESLFEMKERFDVNLSSPVSATILDAIGSGYIVDDDVQPSISISDVSIMEGANLKTAIATFTVSLSQVCGVRVSVNFAIADGSATAGSDYVTKSGTAIINAGATSAMIKVTVTGDSAVELDEDFFLNVINVSNASIIDGQGSGIIRNDD